MGIGLDPAIGERTGSPHARNVERKTRAGGWSGATEPAYMACPPSTCRTWPVV